MNIESFTEEQWDKIFESIEEQTLYPIKVYPSDYTSSYAPKTTAWHIIEEYDNLDLYFVITKMSHIETYDIETDVRKEEYRYNIECIKAVYNDAEESIIELPKEFCDYITETIGTLKINVI